MSDELIKQLFNANIITVLGVALTLAIFFLARGRGKATAAEAETSRIAQQNDGKMIDAITKNADTMSAVKDTFAKMADLQADAIEWHKNHSKAIDDTNSAIIVLNKSIKERSELDGAAIEEFRGEVKTDLGGVKTDIATMKASIDKLTEQIKEILEKKAECEGAEELVNKMRAEILDFMQQQADKRATTTTLTIAPASNVIDATDAGAKPASESVGEAA